MVCESRHKTHKGSSMSVGWIPNLLLKMLRLPSLEDLKARLTAKDGSA